MFFLHFKMASIKKNFTRYECLRDPHGKMPTDPKHATTEEIGGSADNSHADHCANKELHPTVRHIHLHQHCGHHKHQEDHKKRREDARVGGQPINTHTGKLLIETKHKPLCA